MANCKTKRADKKFNCKICGKKFALQYHFNAHLETIHKFLGSIEEKLAKMHYFKSTFRCMFCTMTYASRQGLVSHVRSKHSNQIETIQVMMDGMDENQEFILDSSPSPQLSPFKPPVSPVPNLHGIQKKRGFTIKELLDLEG